MFFFIYFFLFFFFSSRRRHTRWPRDWSSDVCSSDLSTSEATGVDVLDVSSSQEENTADQSGDDPCATPMSSASVPHESATQSGDEDDDATNSDASRATAVNEEPSQEGHADDSAAPSGEVSTTVEATDDNDSEQIGRASCR